MAAQNDIENLHSAWRALTDKAEGDGWQVIPIAVCASCLLSAGRRRPSGEEAILVGFRSIGTVSNSYLPQGYGFEVLWLQSDLIRGDCPTLALARKAGGSLELFALMAADLINLLRDCNDLEDNQIFQQFLNRIHAWQDFMENHNEDLLTAKAELGLFGELILLEQIIAANVPTRNVLDAWQGPSGGLHDFVFGAGGIEVKTTLSTRGFPVIISSIEQLDISLRQPLFLSAVRLSLHPSGRTLPEMVDVIRRKLCNRPTVLDVFEVRLIQAGFLRAATERYVRRFLYASNAILAVQEHFPRLTRINIHPAIRTVCYEIDLDLSGAEDVGLDRALKFLGVT